MNYFKIAKLQINLEKDEHRRVIYSMGFAVCGSGNRNKEDRARIGTEKIFTSG
jgi:hypothetical protein